MNELEQIVEGLKELEGLGLPFRWQEDVFVVGPFHAVTGSGTFHTRLPLGSQGEDILRGVLEREVEARGLWERYNFYIAANVGFRYRPTLLEVINACREVAK